MNVSKAVSSIAGLVIHVFVGSVGFLLIYGIAVGLASGLAWINSISYEVPTWLPVASHYVEQGLFAFDVIIFSAFLISEALHFIRALVKEWKE